MDALKSIGGGDLTTRAGAALRARPAGLGEAKGATEAGGTAFVDAMGGALQNVNRLQGEASRLSREFQMESADVGIEETMIAMQKASLGFQAVVQVRNKVVQAYNDIMNMNV